MKRYYYKAKKGPKNVVTGVIDAEKKEDATRLLASKGLFVFSVVEEHELKNQKNSQQKKSPEKKVKVSKPELKQLVKLRNGKIKQSDLYDFTTQMASLFRSQIDILTALDILKSESTNIRMKEVIESIEADIEQGDSLSAALTKFPDYFPPMYGAMIEAGENSGRLEQMLDELAKAAEKDDEVKSKILTALAYPFLMMGVGVLTVFVLLTFVIPRLMVVFNDLDIELPPATKLLINMGDFMQSYWGIVIIGVALIVMALRHPKAKKLVRGFMLAVKFKIPYFRRVFVDASIVRFSRTLSLLLKSGITLLKALQLTIPLVDSPQMIDELETARDEVIQGSSFAEGLVDSQFFPSRVLHMISVGEKGGRMEEVLEEIAIGYERSMDARMKVISSLIEPMIILFLGLIVGFILWAVLSPIFQMSTLGA